MKRWPVPAYLAGQGFSLLGDEVYYIALVWAAATAGGAAGAALVATAAAVPRALLMLVGGGIADRFGSRAVMVTSDAARMVVIAVTAVLTMGGPDIAVLAVTAVLFGIADAMFMPAAGAMPPRLVEPDRFAAPFPSSRTRVPGIPPPRQVSGDRRAPPNQHPCRSPS